MGPLIVVRFECATEIAAPAAVVFDLSRSIDAHTDSMRRSRERAVAGVTTGSIGLGQEVTWRARHFGIWWRMSSRIRQFEPPKMFVDEQVRGPFAAFRHEHRFDGEPATGVTLMVDLVEFRAPLGPLGRLAEVLVLRWYLRRLIESRNAYIKQRAEDGPGPSGGL
jgi:ligand-binding SRPBCC domain-containing protein